MDARVVIQGAGYEQEDDDSSESEIFIDDGPLTVNALVARNRRMPSRRSTLERTMSLNRKPSRAATLKRGTLRPSYKSRKYGMKGGDHVDTLISNEEEKWIQLQHIKSLTASLDKKRDAREKLIVQPSEKLYGYEKLNFSRTKQWKNFKKNWHDFLNQIELWRGSFKTIEGKFGNSVLSYFQFVRWLLFLNGFIALLMLCVITFPQAFLEPAKFQDTIVHDEPATVYYNSSMVCSMNYTGELDKQNTARANVEKVLDFIQGTGWMEHTHLFLGFYFNKTYTGSTTTYNMSLAHIMCTVLYFLISLLAIISYTAGGIKQNATKHKQELYQFSPKIFNGWDYSLVSPKAAEFKHDQFVREIRLVLDEDNRRREKAEMTTGQKAKMYIVRILVNFFILVTLGGAGALIYMVNYDWVPALLASETVRNSGILELLVEYLPSITISGLYVVLPPIYIILVKFENYEPAFAFKMTILRTVFLRLGSIFMLIISMRVVVQDCDTKICKSCEATQCWETYAGQQFYKLILFFFITAVGVTFFVEFPRKIIVNAYHKSSKLVDLVGYQEFDIVKNVLDLVYLQTLCWIGAFFSPILPSMVFMLCIILFYLKKLSILMNCVPPPESFQASRVLAFLMKILLISFFLCFFVVAFSIGRIDPSQSCSPYRVYSSEDYYMFNAMTDFVLNMPSFLRDFIMFVANTWFIHWTIAILLVLLIYYYVALTASKKRMVELLQEELVMKGKDKQYLNQQLMQALQHGQTVSGGDQQL